MSVATKPKNFTTSAQLNFVRKLVAERDLTNLPAEHAAALEGMSLIPVEVGRYETSKLIDAMLSLPKKAKAAQAPKVSVAPGYYLLGEDIYVVVKSKTNPDRVYAKKMEILSSGRGGWFYAAGALSALAAKAEPLTAEAAAHLGKQYGICMICGRTLTDPSSVEAGIGPICAAKL